MTLGVMRVSAAATAMSHQGWSKSEEAGGLHVTPTEFAHAPGIQAPHLKVRRHRERLRAQGLRPIQIWVPDVRSPAFREEAHRQSLAIAASPQAGDDQAFIDAVSQWDDA